MNQVVQVHLFYPSIISFGGRGIRDSIDLFAIVIGLVGGSLGGWE